MHTITPIKAYSTNYIWCLHNATHAVIVDPGDAEPVIDHLNSNHLQLHSMLITHHHDDHIGGVNALKSAYPNTHIYSNISSLATHIIAPGETIHLQEFNLNLEVLATPGHTLDHVAFYAPGILFCGDTLFSVGCGRIFEGTADMLYQSLMKLRTLPDSTLIFPAHEYTLNNIKFAKTLEPKNQNLDKRYHESTSLITNGKPTLPVAIATEKLTNPFLRCDVEEFKLAVGTTESEPHKIFAHIRLLKDNF